jgi:hypothetical protein
MAAMTTKNFAILLMFRIVYVFNQLVVFATKIYKKNDTANFPLQELDEMTRNVTLAKKNDTIKVLSLQ